MSITAKDFGVTKAGERVTAYTISNEKGMSATVINYGAILTSLIVPDKAGNKADVVLGYDTLEPYFDNASYFGATIGRNANRIENAKFSLDGVTYELSVNDGANNLHTHYDNGFHKKVWEAKADESSNAVVFFISEKDGENGFPGNLDISVTYTLSKDNELFISYSGVSDKKTVINCTNHSYFNLAGHDSGNIHNQMIQIFADEIVPVKAGAIPTGELMKVEGTAFDLRKLTRIGDGVDNDEEQLKVVGGYDHNFCINGADHTTRLCAVAKDEKSGRTLEVYTDLPGVQFYAGNFIADTIGKEGAKYSRRHAFCLETQYYPDSVNQKGFEQPFFEAGEEYKTTTCYKFV